MTATRFANVHRLLRRHAPGLNAIERDLFVLELLDMTKPETWGAAEIQDYTGRPKSTVQNWYRRVHPNFPKPREVIKAGPLWNADDVRDWCALNPTSVHPDSPGFQELRNRAEHPLAVHRR